MNVTKRIGVLIAAGLLVLGLGGTAAYAVAAVFSGGATTQHLVRTEDTASTYNGATWQTLASHSVRVPTFSSRLITARLTGESACTGTGGWCTVRVIIRNNGTGSTTALYPKSDRDFAFDSVRSGTSDDNWESHSVERAIRMRSGSYSVMVQRAVVGSATFRLDDWTYTVDVNR